MKKGLIFAIIFQICVLFSILIKANLPLFLGNEIKLSAKGVDPRDMFLGNYVNLEYDFNLINTDKMYKKNQIIYLSLKEKNGLYEKDKINEIKPENGIFLQGKIISSKNTKNKKIFSTRIKFGIEKYYTTAKNARVLEKKLLQHDAIVSAKIFSNQARIIDIKINE